MYVCEKHDAVSDLYLGIAIPGNRTFQEGRQLKHLSWGQERKKGSFKKYVDTMERCEHRAPNWLQGYKEDHVSSAHRAGKGLVTPYPPPQWVKARSRHLTPRIVNCSVLSLEQCLSYVDRTHSKTTLSVALPSTDRYKLFWSFLFNSIIFYFLRMFILTH